MHTYEIQVYGFHIDVFQHVNNARYLEFLEMARWDYARELKIPEALAAANCGLSVVNINISYQAPARLGDVLTITTQLERLGNKSITLAQTIHKADTPNPNTQNSITTAKVTFVVLDFSTQKALELDGVWRELFTAKQPPLFKNCG